MGRILVLFASKSNRQVYERAVSVLKAGGAEFDLRILSAHKTSEELGKLLAEEAHKYSVIIAGAGLAAHLAGAVASKMSVPVIGVPCPDNFDGLDALLSTLQMPPGVPVLTVGVSMAEEAAEAAMEIAKNEKREIYIRVRNGHAEKAADTLAKMKVRYELSYALHDEAVNIRFVDLGEIRNAENGKGITINCPIAAEAGASDALKLLYIKKGVWVGLNRAENAAIAAAQILGKSLEVKEQRWEAAQAVLKADEEAKG